MYGYSMRSLYEKLRAEKYAVRWECPETEIGSNDLQIVCNMPSLKDEVAWKRCVFVPHSVSEYFPYGHDRKRWPFKFKGALSVGLKTDGKIRNHPLCTSQGVKMVGWPRGDILFSPDKEQRIESLRESLNLPYEKTVLIICASYGHLRWEIPILNEVIPYSKRKFNVIIKERNIKYPNLFTDKDHIKYIKNTEDVTPFYLVTDLLLSIHPASSTLVEIAQVNKPSISVNFGDKDWIKRWRYTFLGEADIFCGLEDLNSNITMLLRSG